MVAYVNCGVHRLATVATVESTVWLLVATNLAQPVSATALDKEILSIRCRDQLGANLRRLWDERVPMVPVPQSSLRSSFRLLAVETTVVACDACQAM